MRWFTKGFPFWYWKWKSNIQPLWPEDERNIKECDYFFPVKYLGSIKVDQENRRDYYQGLIQLKNLKRKSQNATLRMNPYAFEVLDYASQQLIIDQRIEDIKSCDIINKKDKAFCYVCRNNVTQTLMCHGFLAIKDLGVHLLNASTLVFSIATLRAVKRKEAEEMSLHNKGSSEHSIYCAASSGPAAVSRSPAISADHQPGPSHSSLAITAQTATSASLVPSIFPPRSGQPVAGQFNSFTTNYTHPHTVYTASPPTLSLTAQTTSTGISLGYAPASLTSASTDPFWPSTSISPTGANFPSSPSTWVSPLPSLTPPESDHYSDPFDLEWLEKATVVSSKKPPDNPFMQSQSPAVGIKKSTAGPMTHTSSGGHPAWSGFPN